MSESVEDILAAAATATEAAAPTKKERKPKAPAEGSGEPGQGQKEPKAPKVKTPKLYPQWNDDGTPMLDAEGNRVMSETKMAKPKVKREGTGNRARVLPSNVASTITWNEEKAKGYKGARAEFCAMRTDGQTIESYLTAGGDKGFLRFYVRDGAATVTEPGTVGGEAEAPATTE